MREATGDIDYQDLANRYPTAVTPQIGFDTPGFDGRGAAQVDIDPAEWERLKALGAIVMEPWETYYAGL